MTTESQTLMWTQEKRGKEWRRRMLPHPVQPPGTIGPELVDQDDLNQHTEDDVKTTIASELHSLVTWERRTSTVKLTSTLSQQTRESISSRKDWSSNLDHFQHLLMTSMTYLEDLSKLGLLPAATLNKSRIASIRPLQLR